MNLIIFPIIIFSFFSSASFGAEEGLADFCDPEAAEVKILAGEKFKYFYTSNFPTSTKTGKFFIGSKVIDAELISDIQEIEGISYRIYRSPRFQMFTNCSLEHFRVEIIGRAKSKNHEGDDLIENWRVHEAPISEVEKVLLKIISENKLTGVIVVFHSKIQK